MTKKHPVAARFKVRPLPGDDRYVWVLVFHDESSMYAFWYEQAAQAELRGAKRRARTDWLAMSTLWLDKGRKNIGQILLRRGATDISVVGHEIAHMALFYVRDLLGKSVDGGRHDELVCDAVGHMTAQFYRKWWRVA